MAARWRCAQAGSPATDFRVFSEPVNGPSGKLRRVELGQIDACAATAAETACSTPNMKAFVSDGPRSLTRHLGVVFLIGLVTSTFGAEAGWKAGTATADITPNQPQWMAGYGGRTRPAEGTLHPLFIKVLALEDARGHRAIVLSSDLLGIPKSVYENVCGLS